MRGLEGVGGVNGNGDVKNILYTTLKFSKN